MNWSSIKIFFVIYSVFCTGFISFAQQLNFKNYSIEYGLPQSQIVDVCQNHNGVIWFVTNSRGVSRFDGLNNEKNRDILIIGIRI